MKNKSETIVFFGSGPVAAESLRLLSQKFTIESVVTKPRPPHHRGSVPVLELAEKLKLPIKTVANKSELDDLLEHKPFQSQGAVLIDFGIIVSRKVIDYFPLGIINSHFSILPEWRGADPITFAILSGQKQTGVSLMLLVEAMDEGPLLAYGEYDLPPTITTPELTEGLIKLSQALLEDTLPRYLSGNSKSVPQSITGRAVSYSRKLTKEDGIISWGKPVDIIEREIRAFIGWPQSRTKLGNLDIIITKAHIENRNGKPGEIFINRNQLAVYCQSGMLIIDKLKPAGKKEMTGEAFLAGHKNLLS